MTQALYALRAYDKGGALLWRQGAPGIVWGVNITPANKLVVAAYADGTIRWHRLDNGKELLALFIHPKDRRWVAWTPKGYYLASPGAESLDRENTGFVDTDELALYVRRRVLDMTTRMQEPVRIKPDAAARDADHSSETVRPFRPAACLGGAFPQADLAVATDASYSSVSFRGPPCSVNFANTESCAGMSPIWTA
jgi:hypothetical protein